MKGIICLAVGTLGLFSPASANAEPTAALAQKLAKLAADPRLAGAKVGYLVARIQNGQPLVKSRETEQFSVASNAKIVSSVAALSLLGPDFRFKTAVYGRTPVDGTMAGDIYLKGYGDPSLSDTDLWRIAALLYDAGVRRVKGGVVIDESYFDKKRTPPLFDEKKTDAYYRPVCGALSINENVVSVRVLGGERPGEKARLSVIPQSSHLEVRNLVRTANARRRSYVRIGTWRKGIHTVLQVKGRVRVGYRGPRFRKRIADAGHFTGATFVAALLQRGIVLGRKDVRRAKAPRLLGKPLLVHRSRALGSLVRHMNKVSSNFMAEQLLKILGAEIVGRPGTWPKGLKAVAGFLEKLGIKSGSYVLKNGSGLYDATGFSPQQLVRVLRAAFLDFRIGADFVASLPIAASDGTLRNRFIGSGAERYVRAKTGTLNHVVALSGFAGTSLSGTRAPLVFSILINELPLGKIAEAREVADEMARAIVGYLER